MPCSRAESGFDATARSFSPSLVRFNSSHRPRHSANSTRISPIVSFWMRASPMKGTLPSGKGLGICWGSVPNSSWTSELSPRNSPSVMMTTLRALRPSIGRISVRSMTAPAMNEIAIEMAMAATTGMPVVVSFHEM